MHLGFYICFCHLSSVTIRAYKQKNNWVWSHAVLLGNLSTCQDLEALFNATDGGVTDAQQAPGAPIGIAVEATEDPYRVYIGQ